MARLLKFDNFVDEKLDIRPVRKVELSEIKKRIKEDSELSDLLDKAVAKIGEESSVAEYILNGADSWTDVDCKYLIEGFGYLSKFYRKLTDDNEK